MQNELEVKKLKITVSGPATSGKTTLLNTIKACLERDFYFRTSFANWQIELVEKTEDLDEKKETTDE